MHIEEKKISKKLILGSLVTTFLFHLFPFLEHYVMCFV